MRTGESLVPGITLRKILHGHTAEIINAEWSTDGRFLATVSNDQTMRLWDVENDHSYPALELPEPSSNQLAWSPEGYRLAFSLPSSIGIIDLQTGEVVTILNDIRGAQGPIAWSPNGKKIAAGAMIWDFDSEKYIGNRNYYYEKGAIASLIWLDNQTLVIGTSFGGILLENTNTDEEITVAELSKVQNSEFCLAWSPKKSILASGSSDGVVRFWDSTTWKELSRLEGHTAAINRLSFSDNEQFLVSKSIDSAICLWRLDTLEIIARIQGSSLRTPHDSQYICGIGNFKPNSTLLATTYDEDLSSIYLWEITNEILLRRTERSESVKYITAKIVLVGDSGVGKTGLGWRLAHGEFKEHASTHGQQFWVLNDLERKREDGAECEAVLWDLAGQHVYRPIHTIFLENVDTSLILFDPSNRQDPLKGVEFWIEQLKGNSQLPPSLLVGARVDRGSPVLSQQEIEQFCQKYGIRGGYVSTSAKTGEGLARLLDILSQQIPWKEMPATVTSITFKKIKEHILSLKEKPDRGNVLITPEDLQFQLKDAHSDWKFSIAELMTAIGHLENHGYVTVLHNSSGSQYVLLSPDLLVDLASSIYLWADKNEKELGAVNETDLLQGKYKIDELRGLEKHEQQILLEAAVLRFLEHSICFRETLGNNTLLIFPSLIKQKRPLHDEFVSMDDVSYLVSGRIENIYSSLVVLLGYTSVFTRINQWQNQAQYGLGEDEICGFRLVDEHEGEVELVLYYSANLPTYGRTMFQGLFESLLYKREVKIIRFPPIYCEKGHHVERALAVKRIREGRNFIFCEECGLKTMLPELERPSGFGIGESQQIRRSRAMAELRSTYETYLVRVKGFRRDRSAPRSYIISNEEDSGWTDQLIRDLRDAGIQVIEEREQIDKVTKTLVVENSVSPRNSVLHLKFRGPVEIENNPDLSVGDFRPDSRYVVALFDLVLTLYDIPLTHLGFAPLRNFLQQKWENLLGTMSNSREIFVSYAWGGESEEFADQVDQAFQAQGITIIRDKRDLGYKGRIKPFMETIGRGKAVIVIISDKYLKSENCMFELLQIAQNGQFSERIFPIVLDDANIYKPTDRIKYVQYWEQELKNFEKAMKKVSATNLDGFREEIDVYAEIRANFARLVKIIKDINSLRTWMHRDEHFQQLFNAVLERLED